TGWSILDAGYTPILVRIARRFTPECDRSVGKLVQQQSPRDMKAPASGAFRHSLNIAHVPVVSAQLILDGAGRPRRPCYYSLFS
ncbi:MAG: hypothetical protein ACREU2_09815, partial [Steroidobacteraceae bacterium]